MQRHQFAVIERGTHRADDAQVAGDDATNFQHRATRDVGRRGLDYVGAPFADLHGRRGRLRGR